MYAGEDEGKDARMGRRREDARVKRMSLRRREGTERFKVNGEQEQQNTSDVEVGLGMRIRTFGRRRGCRQRKTASDTVSKIMHTQTTQSNRIKRGRERI